MGAARRRAAVECGVVAAAARLVPVAASLLALAAVRGPAADRHELGMGAGGGQYWFRGCASPRQEGQFAELQAWYRREQANGLSWAGELSVSGTRERETGDPPMPAPARPPWNRDFRGVLAARIGYQHRWFGVEAGPAVTKLRVGDGVHLGLLPSIRLTFGLPEYAYAFASLLAEETRGQSRIIGVGLGHAGESIRAALGAGGAQGNDGTVFADFSLKILPAVWVGAGAQIRTADTWSLFGNVTLDLAVLRGR